ncbi:MAG: hypothetical protein RJA70_1806 [Pseudomonadota bacterium]|jgi:hypothetical protein
MRVGWVDEGYANPLGQRRRRNPQKMTLTRRKRLRKLRAPRPDNASRRAAP